MVKEFSTRIAGIYYCKGGISGLNAGDQLLLVREPSNPHDRNAIRVEMQGGVLVGRIPRALAVTLAKAMDAGLSTTAIITGTRAAENGVRTVYTRGGRRKSKYIQSIGHAPPECYIKVTVCGDDAKVLALFPPPPPPIPRPTPPPPAPVRPAYQPAAPKSSCFIATAVFCDAEHPTVTALRVWRDASLAKTRLGRALILTYSVAGPRLARLVNAAPVSRRCLAPLLTRFAREFASSGAVAKPHS